MEKKLLKTLSVNAKHPVTCKYFGSYRFIQKRTRRSIFVLVFEFTSFSALQSHLKKALISNVLRSYKRGQRKGAVAPTPFVARSKQQPIKVR